MTNIALILAAGRGKRFCKSIKKQYIRINEVTILGQTIEKFINNTNIDFMKVVIHHEDIKLYQDTFEGLVDKSKLLEPVFGGDSRQESVFKGLQSLSSHKPLKVLIHDGVRPFISDNLITELIGKTEEKVGTIIAKKVTNTIKKYENQKLETLNRNLLFSVETPQAFMFNEILEAHDILQGRNFTDDASLFEALGYKIEIIESDEINTKITVKEDLRSMNIKKYRNAIGSGLDAHKFTALSQGEVTNIKLGGVSLEFNKKILAHSDGDVLLHALVDAMLGAIAEGDIGMHFPPSDNKWKNADSTKFVTYALNLIKQKQGKINNVDLTLICEKPRIGNYRESIQSKIAELLEINVDYVNLKATTTEKMGFTGREEGIAAQAVILVELPY